MDWKEVLKPTKGKLIFIIVYVILAILFSFSIMTDAPQSIGFPFPFKIEGCYFAGTNCVNEFYPHLLLIDILIPVGIYLGIGILGLKKTHSGA